MNRQTSILTASEVASLLDVRSCIDAVQDAFDALGRGMVPAPAVLGVHVPGGGFHTKAATLDRGERRYFVAKTNANFPSNPQRNGLPSIQGVLVLFDADSGAPLLLADSGKITELRTAAASAVAARRLARADSSVLTLVGCGAQSRSQLRALATVRSLTRVVVLDREPERARRLARQMRDELEVDVAACTDLDAALAETDICVTCTPSRAPILRAGMLRPGTFLAAVGADDSEKQEIACELLAAADKVVADSLAQAAEIGDLHHALAQGAMTVEDVHADLGAVVAGLSPGREGDDEVIVFDSTGLGLQDVAAAAVLYERVMQDPRGVRVMLADA